MVYFGGTLDFYDVQILFAELIFVLTTMVGLVICQLMD